MANLVSVDGRTLTADFGNLTQGFNQGVALRGVLQDRKDRAAQQQQQAYKGQLTQLIADPNTPQDQRDQATSQLLSIDPAAANQIQTHQINQQQAQQNQLKFAQDTQKFNNDQQTQQVTQNLTAAALGGNQNPNAQPAQAGILGGQPPAQGQATTPPNAPQAVTQEQLAAVNELFKVNPEQAIKVQNQLKIQDEKHQAAVSQGLHLALNAPPEKRAEAIMQLPIDDQHKQELLQMSTMEQENALKMGQVALLTNEQRLAYGEKQEVKAENQQKKAFDQSPQGIIQNAKPPALAAAGFAARIEDSEKIIKQLESNKDFDPASRTQGILSGVSGILATPALKEEYRQYEAAKQNFISSVLRLESGAAISPQEFKQEDKKYFPQPGDTPKVIEQKANARKIALKNVINQSQGAYQAQQELDRMDAEKQKAQQKTSTPTTQELSNLDDEQFMALLNDQGIQ